MYNLSWLFVCHPPLVRLSLVCPRCHTWSHLIKELSYNLTSYVVSIFWTQLSPHSIREYVIVALIFQLLCSWEREDLRNRIMYCIISRMPLGMAASVTDQRQDTVHDQHFDADFDWVCAIHRSSLPCTALGATGSGEWIVWQSIWGVVCICVCIQLHFSRRWAEP